MEKRVFCQLNGNRKVIGILRGYDVRRTLPYLILCCCGFGGCVGTSRRRENWVEYEVQVTDVCAGQVFMNIVLDDAFEEKQGGEKVAIGMVVRGHPCWLCGYRGAELTTMQVIRGNSVVMLEVSTLPSTTNNGYVIEMLISAII